MRKLRVSISVLGCFFLSTVGMGQESSVLGSFRDTVFRLDWNVTTALVLRDTCTIWPASVQVYDFDSGDSIPSLWFTVQNDAVLFHRHDSSGTRTWPEQVRVKYRVFPENYQKPLFRLDSSALSEAIRRTGVPIAYDYSKLGSSTQSLPWQTNGLRTSGTYTRGIALGNNQNLSFNSNLNLQFGGKLGDDLEIIGVLSDNSIPLQPDGTTANLQEFDRIFLQIKRGSNTLTAGDFDLLNQQGSYFPRFFKRLQGAQVETRQALPEIAPFFKKKPINPLNRQSDSLYVRAAAAISKGKFNRQLIAATEGNQGPYRLQGAENERFIIVLAGTERVWVDGILLKRGLVEDYVVDYNLAEITFTTRQLMTKDKRITVEFEYAVQNYLRSTLAADVAWNRGAEKRVYVQFYSEQDALGGGGLQDLTPAQRNILAAAGDDPLAAVASGVDTLAENFSADRVLYRYVSVVSPCGASTQVLEYSTNPDSAKYAARFSEVPAGQGNYVRIGSAANGRVYRYVPPDPATCVPQGNYEPVVRLIAPEQRQMFTAGGDFVLFEKKTKIHAEASLTNRDVNRFSPLDAENDQGFGVFTSLEQQIFQKNKWTATAKGAAELTRLNFQALNAYRAQEFARDWNVPTSTTNPKENDNSEFFGRAEAALRHDAYGEMRYQIGSFSQGTQSQGIRQQTHARLQHRGWALTAEGNLLTTEGIVEKSRFSRPKADFSRTFFKKNTKEGLFVLGTYFEREKNARFAAGQDSLSLSSFYYDVVRFYAAIPEKTDRAWSMQASAQQRKDFLPSGSDFALSTSAEELAFSGFWRSKNLKTKQDVRWTGTFRSLEIQRPDLIALRAQETWLGRVDYNLNFWRNVVGLTTGYEAGSGQQPKTDFNYFPVNPGDGQFAWIDHNADGILQVDEMEIAVFADQARYIRVAVNTGDFVATRNLNFNATLRLDPSLWSFSTPKAGEKPAKVPRWLQTVRHFSTQTAVQINRKVLASAEGVSPWNPFQLNVEDTSLVTIGSNIRNILFFNRNNPTWGITVQSGNLRNRFLLTTGLEGRSVLDNGATLRYNFAKSFVFEGEILQQNKRAEAENFAARRYDILAWSVKPKVTWIPNKAFRMSVDYSALTGENRLGALESANIQRGQLEVTWSPTAQEQASGFRPTTSIRGKLSLAAIEYAGENNTPVAYTLLDGLQNGQNLLWSFTADRQLSRSMQLSLVYDGRKTGVFGVIHTGRAQVRAIF